MTYLPMESKPNGMNLPDGIHKKKHEEQKPMCDVYLVVWRTPPSRKWKSWFSISSDCCNTSSRAMQHWGLQFRLKNGALFLLEAVEKGGKLVGRMQNNGIECEPLEQIPLGSHELDYGDIANAYGEMSKPEKYDVVKNNCQEWIVKLCNLMKISVPNKVYTLRELLSLPSDTKLVKVVLVLLRAPALPV